MTQKKPIPVKYFYYGMLGCVIFIGTVFFFIWQKEAKEEKLLQEKGIIADAIVLNLNSSKTSKKASSNYFMKVGFFADTNAVKLNPIDTITKTAKTSDELLKNIEKIGKDNAKPFGNYYTVILPINLNDFQKYMINDNVKIKYVKDDPSIAKLMRE